MAFYIGYNLIYTASCYISGNLADRFPKRWVLAVGYSVAAIPAMALLLPGNSFAKFAVVFGFPGFTWAFGNVGARDRRNLAA